MANDEHLSRWIPESEKLLWVGHCSKPASFALATVLMLFVISLAGVLVGGLIIFSPSHTNPFHYLFLALTIVAVLTYFCTPGYRKRMASTIYAISTEGVWSVSEKTAQYIEKSSLDVIVKDNQRIIFKTSKQPEVFGDRPGLLSTGPFRYLNPPFDYAYSFMNIEVDETVVSALESLGCEIREE